VQGRRVTRRKHRAVPSTRDGTLAGKLSRRAPRERSEQRGCKEGMLCPDEAKRRRERNFCLPIAIGTGTNFIEHYECRAAPRLNEVKAGAQV